MLFAAFSSSEKKRFDELNEKIPSDFSFPNFGLISRPSTFHDVRISWYLTAIMIVGRAQPPRPSSVGFARQCVIRHDRSMSRFEAVIDQNHCQTTTAHRPSTPAALLAKNQPHKIRRYRPLAIKNDYKYVSDFITSVRSNVPGWWRWVGNIL